MAFPMHVLFHREGCFSDILDGIVALHAHFATNKRAPETCEAGMDSAPPVPVFVSGSSCNNGEPPKPVMSKRGMKREKRREAWRKRKADGKEARAAKAARLGGAGATTGDPPEVASRKPNNRTVAKEAQRAVARSVLGLGRSVCQMSLRLSNHDGVWGVSIFFQPFSSTFNHAASAKVTSHAPLSYFARVDGPLRSFVRIRE
jgi:hypothetical protein